MVVSDIVAMRGRGIASATDVSQLLYSKVGQNCACTPYITVSYQVLCQKHHIYIYIYTITHTILQKYNIYIHHIYIILQKYHIYRPFTITSEIN